MLLASNSEAACGSVSGATRAPASQEKNAVLCGHGYRVDTWSEWIRSMGVIMPVAQPIATRTDATRCSGRAL